MSFTTITESARISHRLFAQQKVLGLLSRAERVRQDIATFIAGAIESCGGSVRFSFIEIATAFDCSRATAAKYCRELAAAGAFQMEVRERTKATFSPTRNVGEHTAKPSESDPDAKPEAIQNLDQNAPVSRARVLDNYTARKTYTASSIAARVPRAAVPHRRPAALRTLVRQIADQAAAVSRIRPYQCYLFEDLEQGLASGLSPEQIAAIALALYAQRWHTAAKPIGLLRAGLRDPARYRDVLDPPPRARHRPRATNFTAAWKAQTAAERNQNSMKSFDRARAVEPAPAGNLTEARALTAGNLTDEAAAGRRRELAALLDACPQHVQAAEWRAELAALGRTDTAAVAAGPDPRAFHGEPAPCCNVVQPGAPETAANEGETVISCTNSPISARIDTERGQNDHGTLQDAPKSALRADRGNDGSRRENDALPKPCPGDFRGDRTAGPAAPLQNHRRRNRVTRQRSRYSSETPEYCF